MIAWLLNLFRVEEPRIDLARVQWAEREERRATMERELSGRDAAECRERVVRRMTLGDVVWIPPYYKKEAAHEKWKARDWERRVKEAREQRREA